MRLHSTHAVAMGLAWVCLGASEETDDQALKALAQLMETRVQVSSAEARSVFTTPSTVSFLDRDFLARYGVRTLADALSLVAGMEVDRSGLRTDLPTARGVLQENYANRVLLLIDGVPSWMALTGDPVLARIDIHDVERIEILKGPASVLYGSNAYAGAVNVVLRKEGAPVQAHGAWRSRGGWEGGAGGLFEVGPLAASVAANAGRETGTRKAFTGEDGIPFPLDDFREDRNLSASLRGRGHSLLLNAFSQRYPHLGNAIRSSGGGGKTWIEDGWLLDYRYRGRLGEGLAWGVNATHDQGGREFDSSLGGTLAYRIKVHRRNAGLNLGSAEAIGAPFIWQVGLDQEVRTSVYDQAYDPRTGATLSESGLLDRSVSEGSAFGQATWAGDRWGLFLGTRYTKNARFGSNLASRATVLYQLGPQHSVKLIWGQSYRSPTLLEQYLVLPGVLNGNPDVKPETSDSVELAYLVATGDWFVQAQAYWMALKGKLIRARRYPRFTSDPADITVTYINGRPFETAGLELELKYRPAGSLDAFLNLAYAHGSRGDALPGIRGTNFRFVPMVSAKGGLSRSWGPFTASATALFQGRSEGPVAPIPSWTGWGLHLGWVQYAGRYQVRHALDGRNLGDRERLFPENARRNLNAIPEGMGRSVAYGVTVAF